MYQFSLLQKNTKQIQEANEDSIIYEFELSMSNNSSIKYSGRINKADKRFIYLDVSYEYSTSLKTQLDNCFNIVFRINRHTYKIQHQALEYFDQFKLHTNLINNGIFNKHENHPTDLLLKYTFKGQF